MTKDAEQIKSELAKPFAPEDLEWRLQQAFEDKGRGLAVAYVTNRAIQDRLDDVVGPENWHNDFKPWHSNGKKESQICGISIHFEGRGFVTKWDGAEDTDIEAVKGGLSDSMKRAAVQWGIGRILYKMGAVWVNIEKRGRSWVIKDSERDFLDKAYMDLLRKLKLTPAQPGGLQSELTPRSDGTQQPSQQPQAAPGKAPAQPQTTKPAPVQQTPSAQPATNVTPMPAPQPAWEYIVTAVNVQTGMSQNVTTSLTLQGKDGKTLRAFRRGADAALVPGAMLTDVKLTMKTQDAVVFHVLDSYKIMNAMPQAA